jgi:hypothetical protein
MDREISAQPKKGEPGTHEPCPEQIAGAQHVLYKIARSKKEKEKFGKGDGCASFCWSGPGE